MKQDQSASAVMPVKKVVSAGITSGTIDPMVAYPQVLSSNEGELSGSAATFPPGALAVSAQISIQEGASIATPALAGSLSITSGFQSTATPVAVTADRDMDTAKPFTIAIPLPATTASLFSLSDPYENLVVAYVVKIAATGETRVGVMPRSALVINDNRVSFDSYYFGVFQAALTAQKVQEERKTESAVIAVQTKAAQQSLPPLAIRGRAPFVAKEGQTVTLRGTNFRSTIRLALNGKAVSSLNLASDTSLSFVAPSDTSLGLAKLTAEQDGTVQDVSLIFSGKGTIPVFSDDKSKVCSDVQFYDLGGVLQTGTRNCNAVAVADCAADGEVGCKTTASYKAAKMATFAASNIASGVTIAGVAGTQSGAESHGNCTANGAIGCVTTATFQAADLSNLITGNVKSGVSIAGIAGTYGPACTTDGAGSCLVDGTMYKAAKLSNFGAADVKLGVTIAGLAGTLSGTPANCASNGEVGCVTTSTYKAADLTNLVSGNIKNGIMVAGTTGTYPSLATPLAGFTATADLTSLDAATPAGPYEFFDSAGTRYTGTISDAGTVTAGASDQTFSTSLYRQFTVAGDVDLAAGNIKSGITIFGVVGSLSGSPANCSANGEIGCVTTVVYKAADLSNLTVGNVKSGVMIAGITGDYPSATYPLSGADGTTDLPAFSSTAGGSTYEWFQADGTRMTGSIQANQTVTPSTSNQTLNIGLYRSVMVNGDANLVAGNIKNGVSIFGMPGSVVAESHANCGTDGAIGCVTTASYRSADSAFATPGNIRAGMVIAGVSGAYPSGSYPLNGSDSTPDLDMPTFNIKMKGGSMFEWFDSTGARYATSGDPDIVAANIYGGVDIFGTTGSIINCATDGQVGCVTSTQYRAANTAAFSPSDIRKGKTIASIPGELFFARNMAFTSTFDRITGTSGMSGVDIYDTLDDYGNGTTFPTQNPAGWDLMNGTNWVMDTTNDNGTSGGTPINGICDGGEACVFKDKVSGLMWSKDTGTTFTWENAISQCENYTYGGYSDWRLPTQKELLQAYIDGIWSQKVTNKLNLMNNYYWSGTTYSITTTSAWAINPALASSMNQMKSVSTYQAMCVR